MIILAKNQMSLFEQYDELTQNITDDINNYLFEKYCNSERDSISVERMKVKPLNYQELIELYSE